MDPRSEVLLRNAEHFSGSLLLAGLPNDQLLGHFAQAQGWSWHAGDYAALQARFNQRCQFGTTPPAANFQHCVLFLPKSRELTDYLLAALAHAAPEGEIYLVGEKRAGIERAAKQLQSYGSPRKLDSARHCQLWKVRVEKTSQSADLTQWQQRFELALPDGPLTVVSLPGVFSHGRLDVGSALLLEHLDNLGNGHLLDFGCGAGIIGSVLKRQNPQRQLTLLDVDAFAIAASQLTLKANQLEATVIAADGIQGAPQGLNAIVSNPPFHTGVHTDYQATETLLKQAKQHLLPGGQLRLVANSFLKYPTLIEEHFAPCQTLAEGNGFRVYQAKRN